MTRSLALMPFLVYPLDLTLAAASGPEYQYGILESSMFAAAVVQKWMRSDLNLRPRPMPS